MDKDTFLDLFGDGSKFKTQKQFMQFEKGTPMAVIQFVDNCPAVVIKGDCWDFECAKHSGEMESMCEACN